KGALIGRRSENSEIVPYHDRGAIEAGALDGQKLEICWVRDPFEALAIQIQGSARVILEDGTPLRLNYDSHNGFPYTSVGRVLIERTGSRGKKCRCSASATGWPPIPTKRRTCAPRTARSCSFASPACRTRASRWARRAFR